MGYTNNSKSYRVYNASTRRMMEIRNVIFIKTQSLLFPPGRNFEADYYTERRHGRSQLHRTDYDFLRDLRDYTSVLEPLPGACADHIAVGGPSDNPSVSELLERISEITRRDTLDRGATGPLQEGVMPGREPTDGVSQEGVLEPQEQPESPAGASLETPLAGSQPLQRREHSRLGATSAVTRAGAAANSFLSA